MRRGMRRTLPSFCQRIDLGRRGDIQGYQQAFKRGDPCSVIALAAGPLHLRGKRIGPLVPAEQAAFMQRDHHRKGLSLPRFCEDRGIGRGIKPGQDSSPTHRC